MAATTRLLAMQAPRILGRSDSVLKIGEEEKAPGTWAGRRLLTINDRPAFELTLWCGTCPFLFERLGGSNETLSIESLQELLNEGLDQIDEDVVGAFAALLPEGRYVPVLTEIQPALTYPMKPGDYFAEEQDRTWKSSEGFWGLPEYPRTPYYRCDTRNLDAENLLFEFVVPMVPPSINDPERVRAHAEKLSASALPTCVAISTLDVTQRAVASTDEEGLIHWGLTHFLLDGHHKIEAAANAGKRLRLLSLLTIDHSLADESSIATAITSISS